MHADQLETVQAPFSHVTVADCVPQSLQSLLPEGFVEGLHAQALHAPQVPPPQLAVQVLVCVPPFPHVCEVGWVCVGLVQVPVQEPVTQEPLLHVTLLVCVPQPLAQD